MTTGERLVQLSGLPTGTAIQHLLALGSFGALTTGDQLVAASPLTTGTSAEHLIAIDGQPPVVIPSGGGGGAMTGVGKQKIKDPSLRGRTVAADHEEIVMLIKMISRCL